MKDNINDDVIIVITFLSIFFIIIRNWLINQPCITSPDPLFIPINLWLIILFCLITWRLIVSLKNNEKDNPNQL